jgi:hypothetical protein
VSRAKISRALVVPSASSRNRGVPRARGGQEGDFVRQFLGRRLNSEVESGVQAGGEWLDEEVEYATLSGIHVSEDPYEGNPATRDPLLPLSQAWM